MSAPTPSKARPPRRRTTRDDASPELRLAILDRDRWQCQRCGVRLQNTNRRAKDYGQAGHIVSRIDGGLPVEGNLQAECLGCNLAAGGSAGHRATRDRSAAYEREIARLTTELARVQAEGVPGAGIPSAASDLGSDAAQGGGFFGAARERGETPLGSLLSAGDRAGSGMIGGHPAEPDVIAGQRPKSNDRTNARSVAGAAISPARADVSHEPGAHLSAKQSVSAGPAEQPEPAAGIYLPNNPSRAEVAEQPREPVQGSASHARKMVPRNAFGVTAGIYGRHVEPAEWASVPWLTGLRRPPASATWPRFMSPPHPNAVGSYGLAFEKSIKRRGGRPLRWWQRLAARRILEHDAAGELCWPEWFLTLSRQGGKSWLLRELAMWRLEQAGRLGEPQFVMHVGNRLVNATEVQAPARAWAKGQGNGWRAFEAQGTQEVRDPDGNRWRCFAQNAVYGFSAGLSLVDEAWEIEAAAVEDGIEPTMIERRWPQLGIISTAHGRATSLAIDRRRVALNGGSGLIIEWSTPPWFDLADRAGWRMASPHWSPQREALMDRAFRKSLQPRTRRLDEMDPVTTFRTQWLNQWPERSIAEAGLKGHALLADGVWAGLQREAEIDGPITFAIEDNAGVSVAIAAAGRSGDLIAVSAYSVSDRALGWQWIAAHAEQHPGSTVLVGSTLADDREVIELPCRAEPMAYGDTRQALSLLRTIAGRQGIAHANSPGLAEQIDLCRVADGSTGVGLRVTSADRWDILRAAAWAIAAVERERNSAPAVY